MSLEARKPRPTVLAFHRLASRLSLGVNNYAPARFDRLLADLAERGYSCDDPGDILLTFDDAYQHLVDSLPPFVNRYGFKPMLFVPTAYIGRKNRWDFSSTLRKEMHLSRSELKHLARVGVRFGSHGCTHRDLTCLPDAALRQELMESKAILEDLFGEEVDCISYPFGRCNDRVMKGAQAVGYRQGFTMRFPTPQDTDWNQGRIGVYAYDTPFSVRMKLGPAPMRMIESFKASVVNRLATGTTVYNRFFRRAP